MNVRLKGGQNLKCPVSEGIEVREVKTSVYSDYRTVKNGLAPKIDKEQKPGKLYETPNDENSYGGKILKRNSKNENFSKPSVPDRQLKPLADQNREPFQRELVKIYGQMVEDIRARSKSSSQPCKATGLYNLGNTCFMNATLQALCNTPALCRIFSEKAFVRRVNRHNRFGTQGTISACFGALLDEMTSRRWSAITPLRFLTTFADNVNRDMGNGKQHDAQEFQIFLLDALHEDLNEVSQRKSVEQNNDGKDLRRAAKEAQRNGRAFSASCVNDIFQLQTISILKCTACNKRSVTFEDLTQISLELPSDHGRVSLDQCLRTHFSTETLTGSCSWQCPTCNRPQKTVKQTALWRCPDILVIHLKRFSHRRNNYNYNYNCNYNNNNNYNSGFAKNEILVDFPVKFSDLAKFVHAEGEPMPRSYRLYAVTNHFGRLESGHYTCLALNEKSEKSSQWLKYDDEMVSPVSPDEVKSSAAYILFYVRD